MTSTPQIAAKSCGFGPSHPSAFGWESAAGKGLAGLSLCVSVLLLLAAAGVRAQAVDITRNADSSATSTNSQSSARNSGYWVRQDVQALPTPQAGRITDASIHQDYLSYETQQARVNASAGANNPYASAKAQCWLDVSFQEYTRNDRSSFVEEAFLESTKITTALATGSGQPWLQNPLLNQATNRPEPLAQLWARVNQLSDSQRRCKPAQTACAEVELVHAGNEWNQGGQPHATPYMRLADRYITQAQTNECPAFAPAPAPAPVAAYAAPVLVASPVVASPITQTPPARPVVPAPPEREALVAAKPMVVVTLAQRVHFPFDQYYIAPRTYQVLDRIAAALKADPNLKLQAIGHTDTRASDSYNLNLSLRRVSAVLAYLRAAGAMPGQVQLGALTQASPTGAKASSAQLQPGAAGKSQPDKSGNKETAHQYNRRVEFALAPGSTPARLEPQTADLHPCGGPKTFWCDNPKTQQESTMPLAARLKINADKAQMEAMMRRLYQ